MSDDAEPGLSRRQLLAAGTTGLIATAAVPPAAGASRRRAGAADGTPEQIHLTWGDDPARPCRGVLGVARPGARRRGSGSASGSSPPPSARPYTDGTTARSPGPTTPGSDGLRPGATYGYAVTADNDRNAADPFSATFSTAPEGRAPFRFTSFGDLAAANARRAGGSYGQARLRGRRRGVLPAAVPPAQRRPVLRRPEPGGAAARCGGTSATTSRPRPRTGRGCRCPGSHGTELADGQQGWRPT